MRDVGSVNFVSGQELGNVPSVPAFVRPRICPFSKEWISVGDGVPLPRPRIQVVHGTVPRKYARNALPARSGILYRPAIAGLRGHPLPTSSTRAPEVTPN